jgi:hypothetical protein
MRDTFRKAYHPLSTENSRLVVQIKEKAEDIEELLGLIDSREKNLAIINLEQCTMWATKAIVLSDEKDKE